MQDSRRSCAVWLRRGRDVYHVSSPFEERDVWKLRLEKLLKEGGRGGDDEAEFDEVVGLAGTREEKAVVNVCRAEYHLMKGRPEVRHSEAR